MEKWLTDQVKARANNRCEYCRMANWLYSAPFHLDHVISRKHGGATELSNLAMCCLDCNLHKGTDIAGLDPRHGGLTRLFNPGTDAWEALSVERASA